jgi:hypothetical protein
VSEEILVPLGLFFSGVGTVWLLSHFSYKKNTLIHETIRHAVEKGQELPEDTVQKLGELINPRSTDLRRGVLLVAFSLAIMILAMIAGDGDDNAERGLFAISMFPLLLGGAYLGLWFFGRNKRGL